MANSELDPWNLQVTATQTYLQTLSYALCVTQYHMLQIQYELHKNEHCFPKRAFIPACWISNLKQFDYEIKLEYDSVFHTSTNGSVLFPIWELL